MEPLLVLGVTLGDVGDKVVGYHLHVVGEARADDRHRSFHPGMKGIPHSIPQPGT